MEIKVLPTNFISNTFIITCCKFGLSYQNFEAETEILTKTATLMMILAHKSSLISGILSKMHKNKNLIRDKVAKIDRHEAKVAHLTIILKSHNHLGNGPIHIIRISIVVYKLINVHP